MAGGQEGLAEGQPAETRSEASESSGFIQPSWKLNSVRIRSISMITSLARDIFVPDDVEDNLPVDYVDLLLICRSLIFSCKRDDSKN